MSPFALVLVSAPTGGLDTKFCAASQYCFEFANPGNSFACLFQCSNAFSTAVRVFVVDQNGVFESAFTSLAPFASAPPGVKSVAAVTATDAPTPFADVASGFSK